VTDRPRTVTVDVVGEDTREVAVAADATYGDLLRAVDLGIHEATALVDGTPVPEDRPVDPGAGTVRVLRLVKGG
jgi:sulfur carrier protein